MKPERIVDGYYFDPSITDEEKREILSTCLLYLEGVRDLDLVAKNNFLKLVYKAMNTQVPVVYLKPEQMSTISETNSTRKNLNRIIATSPAFEERTKAKKLLDRINLFKEIIKNSLSAVDLGLVRRIDVFKKSDKGLCLKIVYCLTTEKCPHVEAVKYCIARACLDAYHDIRKNKNFFLADRIVDAEVQLEKGDPWKSTDIDPRILDILSGGATIRTSPTQNKDENKSGLRIIN